MLRFPLPEGDIRRLLVLGSHADDIEIGCGATVLALAERYPRAAFFAYAYPAPAGIAEATLAPAAAHWDATLGEFILDWDDIREGPDPHGAALEFARSAVRHGCKACGWDVKLAASAEGVPPPVR